MHKAINHIRRLNIISNEILSQLNEEDLSLESLNHTLQKRQHSIDGLSDLAKDLSRIHLSEEERDEIVFQLDNFQNINNIILDFVEKIMNDKSRNIATTMQQQRAVKSYTLSEKPDITYLKQI